MTRVRSTTACSVTRVRSTTASEAALCGHNGMVSILQIPIQIAHDSLHVACKKEGRGGIE